MKAILSLICVLLAANLYLEFEARQERQTEERARGAIIAEVITASAKIDEQRSAVFTDLMTAMADYDTKSIYHQIYHVNKAQLQMQNLAVQEHQLLIHVLAGKK